VYIDTHESAKVGAHAGVNRLLKELIGRPISGVGVATKTKESQVAVVAVPKGDAATHRGLSPRGREPHGGVIGGKQAGRDSRGCIELERLVVETVVIPESADEAGARRHPPDDRDELTPPTLKQVGRKIHRLEPQHPGFGVRDDVGLQRLGLLLPLPP
jgi:hypothetical protein